MSESDRARWDERWRAVEASGAPGRPSKVLERIAAPDGLGVAREPGGAPVVAAGVRALDLGGGAGDNALWLAQRGVHVTVADRSPIALRIARQRATEAKRLEGSIETLCVDLEAEPVPAGPWDVVLSIHFLDRRVIAAVADVLVPGGVLIVVHPTRANLERHDRPSRRFLLEPGELARLVALRLTVIYYEEGWLLDGRHEACAVARNGGG